MKTNFLIIIATLFIGFFASTQSTTIDNTFNVGVGFDNTVNNISLQSDGKVVVGGSFLNFNGTASNRIIRLNSNGSNDNTFITNAGFNNVVSVTSLQSDGKIVVGGNFSHYDNIPSNKIARLNSNGSIDNSFVVGSGFNGNISALVIQSDGKIIVGGAFTTYNFNTANQICRLNTDGTIDNTFTSGSGLFGGLNGISIQSDGKILIGGSFTTYNGVAVNRILRLNSNGTIDNTFNCSVDGFVKDMIVQSDGKILIGGGMSICNSVSLNKIARLNSNGTIDNTFTIGSGFDNNVQKMEIQFDGKIVVCGGFTSYNGTSSNRIARLNSNGTIDNTFTVNTGFNGFTSTMTVQPNGRILVGGVFTSYEGTTSNRMIRLMGDCIPTYSVDVETSCGSYTWMDGNTYTASTNSPTFVTTNSDGCDSTITLNLTILNSTSSSSDETICQGETFSFFGQNLTNSGTYNITVSNSNGCDSIITLNLVVIDLPNVNIIQTNNVLTVNGTFSAYQWFLDGSSISGATNETYTATITGSYSIEVTNGNGCSNTSASINVTVSDTADVDINNKTSFGVYPNPSNGKIVIKYDENSNDLEMNVFSSTGKLVKMVNITNGNVDLTELPKGVYFLKISNVVEKIIIE